MARSCCWLTRTGASGTAVSSPKARQPYGNPQARNRPGPYQIQGAHAVHDDAPEAAAIDWWQILQLYNHLETSPMVALNRAVAVAEVEGSHAALTIVDGLNLPGY